ncbi:hypothetical protein DSL92_07845 [Billgrantia gudaonensis]|uniref:GGDEF domain-containing protein n=1 Tax=Billgrantia gudaonensis TaxID=376427 RepID=A0A432JIC4_9GAMM|nr:hypothetical protein DSL92_07845 [Halomonas gudaonensis]
MGVACHPADATTTSELFKSASIALYHAKLQDSGAYARSDVSMTHDLKRRW